jgi:DNA topoisomerase-3
MEFAKALKINTNRKNGYLESDEWIITWCVGHLVTMSYPEKYDENLKFWRLDTLPFIPTEWKYEIIPAVQNQFNVVQSLMQREDIEEIYNAGDSGREGEYIQRLVLMMANPNPTAKKKRVWIDSQTEEEILRGIKEAKDQSEYDSLSDSAYLRAKEDYLIRDQFFKIIINNTRKKFSK